MIKIYALTFTSLSGHVNKVVEVSTAVSTPITRKYFNFGL